MWQRCSEATLTGAALCKVRVFITALKLTDSLLISPLLLFAQVLSWKCSCILLPLFDRDARGMTPFMLAVSGRAYPAAITVLEAAQKMAKGELTSWLRTGSLFNGNFFCVKVSKFKNMYCINIFTQTKWSRHGDICTNIMLPTSCHLWTVSGKAADFLVHLISF